MTLITKTSRTSICFAFFYSKIPNRVGQSPYKRSVVILVQPNTEMYSCTRKRGKTKTKETPVDNDIATDMLIPWQMVDIQSEKRREEKREEQDVSR